ncbi:adaptin ear-binding coat-associated protein 1 NECAP-1 [Coprinellus micaceus]|uniref:Adaptin ear-binding coat-associated protein 1 NECAP-1 n=1 Tax=Coprinellus micaceus TaxID=71717 RepID=A0A4Y7TR86_COPMI|nr:adaptin ear-binding coat-associated protein 1 NECAP-1 [Coprinellus micaceus]
MDDDIESILYIAREISVYRIPPLKKNEGYRAGEWGDLAQPLWKGRLRVLENSKGVTLMFEDSQTALVFAKTEYDPNRPSVEGVLDSSRYFVVRVEDGSKKAYIGMGFAERTDSFDFNVALQDYSKRFRAALEAASEAEEQVAQAPAGPKKDYTLKEGQTFSIAIPGRNKPSVSASNLLGGDTSSTSAGGGGAFPLLPPPPSANKRRP